MKYEIFKEELLTELKDFYGNDATKITVRNITDGGKKRAKELTLLYKMVCSKI